MLLFLAYGCTDDDAESPGTNVMLKSDKNTISIGEVKKLDELIMNYRYKVTRKDCSDADLFAVYKKIYFGYLLDYINIGKSRFE